ncbi:MAG: hypothetical protein ACREI9_02110 [Nitrospiraceae bacterium]
MTAVVWCAISGHGFGHAAQVVPVLNELGRLKPDLRAILRTQVPPWFFQDRLTQSWTHSPAQQDIGCIQHSPLQIDVAATWDAHARFHRGWKRKVQEEVRSIQAAQPSLVLSDISHLAIEAGARAGIPTIGLCNLSWDQILEPLAQPGRTDQRETVAHIQRAYAHADLMLRPAPGLALPAFSKIVDIGPIASPLAPDPAALRYAISAVPTDRIVVVGFGGIALDALPFERLEQLAGYQFIVSGTVPDWCRRSVSASALAMPFGALLASADLIVTKPGYSTVVEAVALGKPVVYVRRYNFADEQSLVDYLHRYGRAVELSTQDFSAGRWDAAFDTAWSASPQQEHAPPATGAIEAAHLLSQHLDGHRQL